jgi:ribosomal protein S18 acetylase RimI-like enzyme
VNAKQQGGYVMTRTSILTTRPLAHSDFAAWFSLWTRYLHHNDRRMPWTDRAALFRTLTQPTSDATALVVECAGKMVGFAHCKLPPADDDKACHVQDFYIIPVFQAMRAGAVLMREVYRAAQDAGASTVYFVPTPQPTPQPSHQPNHQVDAPRQVSPLRKAA